MQTARPVNASEFVSRKRGMTIVERLAVPESMSRRMEKMAAFRISKQIIRKIKLKHVKHDIPAIRQKTLLRFPKKWLAHAMTIPLKAATVPVEENSHPAGHIAVERSYTEETSSENDRDPPSQ